MQINGYKKLVIILSTLLAVACGVIVYGAHKNASQQAHVLQAWGQFCNYWQCRDLAHKSTPQYAVYMLEIIAHVPKGTNGPLDWMVERERERDAHDVIEYLRKATGEDLGEEPTNWIKKYK